MPAYQVMTRSRPLVASAAERYRYDELEYRVAAATPAQLVAILYDAMRLSAAGAERASRVGDAPARLRHVARALAILDGLDTSLDHVRGGVVARALGAAYAQIRALLVAGNIEASADLFAGAAATVEAIGASWRAIADADQMAA